MKPYHIISVAALVLAGAACACVVMLQSRFDEQQAWIEEHDAQVAELFREMGNAIQRMQRRALPLRGPAPALLRPNIDSRIMHSIVVFPNGTFIGGDAVPVEKFDLLPNIAGPR